MIPGSSRIVRFSIRSGIEVARMALETLIVDGRIHPARIEEMMEKAQKEVDHDERKKVNPLPWKLAYTVFIRIDPSAGRMKFRSATAECIKAFY